MSASSALERARAARAALDAPSEGERISRLQRLTFTEEERWQLVEKWHAALRVHEQARKPRPIQAELFENAAWAAAQDGPIGVVGDMGVGLGKTLCLLNLPKIFDAKRPVLLLPSALKKQLEADAFEWANEYSFARRGNVYNVIPYLHIITYGQLSSPDSSDLLTRIDPDFIAADEAHALRNHDAARTRRFLRFMDANPHVIFCPFSGSFQGKSVKHYAHLVQLALRQHSPMPRYDEDLDAMSAVMDVDGEPDGPSWRRVSALGGDIARACRVEDVSGARVAFQRLFAEAAGVVSSSEAALDKPLHIRAVNFDPGPVINGALADLAAKGGTLPSGEEPIDAARLAVSAANLSLGFYYYWDWPGEPDEEWLEARREWHKACRTWLGLWAFEGVDSPMLLERYLKGVGGLRWPAERAALEKWEGQRHKEKPPTAWEWIDPSPIIRAVSNLKPRTLVWFESRAVGEMLQALGVPTYWEGDPRPGETSAVSIEVFHRGKNYQHSWHRNLIIQPPASGDKWDQLLARTHRPGQEYDVEAEVYQHAWPLRNRFQSALDAARYSQEIGGTQHKLLIAELHGFRSTPE